MSEREECLESGEVEEGAAARGERELGENAQAVGDPRGERLRASSAGDDKVLRMGTASIPRLITEFAIPSVVGMLINGSYAIIDSVFLGHAVGEIGLSAMTVANPIMIVFMAIAMLIGNGGNALAALRLGEGKRDEAERALGNVVSLSLVAAVIVLVIGWNPALVFLGARFGERHAGGAPLRPDVHPDSLCRLHLAVHRPWREQLHPHRRRPEPRAGHHDHRRRCMYRVQCGCSCWSWAWASWAARWPPCAARPSRAPRCCGTSA